MKSNIFLNHGERAVEQPAAAVAIITCRRPVKSILLVRRVKNERDPWSGHFAFPGGRRERQDRSSLQTCVREVREETAIELSDQALREIMEPAMAGRSASKAVLVQPFVFELAARPEVTVDVAEISGYVWLETARFQETARHRIKEVLPGVSRPVYPLNDYCVWGFTYSILCRILRVDMDAVIAGAGR